MNASTAIYSGESTHVSLLGRLKTLGDQAAWRDFCDRYGALIRRFSSRRGLQPSDCDDILQETLLALAKSMPTFQYDPSRGSFRGYLKTVAVHIIFRKICQTQRPTPPEEIEKSVRSAMADPEVEADWETEWRQHHLRAAMKSIEAEFNERDRAAFDAYVLHGAGAAEAAKKLDMSTDQVYQAKARILKRLTQLVEAQVREEG